MRFLRRGSVPKARDSSASSTVGPFDFWRLVAPQVEHGRPELGKRGVTSVMGKVAALTTFAWQSSVGDSQEFSRSFSASNPSNLTSGLERGLCSAAFSKLRSDSPVISHGLFGGQQKSFSSQKSIPSSEKRAVVQLAGRRNLCSNGGCLFWTM